MRHGMTHSHLLVSTRHPQHVTAKTNSISRCENNGLVVDRVAVATFSNFLRGHAISESSAFFRLGGSVLCTGALA